MKILIVIFIGVLGAILGSFYACMGYRIPNKISLSKPNSYCESCKKEIKWYMNIPVFSYLFLRGKCAYCKSKIDSLSFIVEVLTSFLFVVFYLKYGFSVTFFISLVLISVLGVTMVSDFKYYYVSDRVVILGLISLIVLVYFEKDFMFYKIISGIVMFLLMFLIKIIGDKSFKRESLGGGDVKLLGLIGLALGFYPTLISLVISCSMTLVYYFLSKQDEKEIPFGPFLLIGALLILYFIPNFSLI